MYNNFNLMFRCEGMITCTKLVEYFLIITQCETDNREGSKKPELVAFVRTNKYCKDTIYYNRNYISNLIGIRDVAKWS